MSLVFLRAGILIWFLLAACVPSLERDPNENSGNDGERATAQALVLGEPVNDHLNYSEGDMTDWKFVQVVSPGEITVTVGCDNAGAWCSVNVRDEVGRVVGTIETEGEVRASGVVEVGRGNYYIEVFVQASQSAYTIQVDYGSN
jgi:hypothetical protein